MIDHNSIFLSGLCSSLKTFCLLNNCSKMTEGKHEQTRNSLRSSNQVSIRKSYRVAYFSLLMLLPALDSSDLMQQLFFPSLQLEFPFLLSTASWCHVRTIRVNSVNTQERERGRGRERSRSVPVGGARRSGMRTPIVVSASEVGSVPVGG